MRRSIVALAVVTVVALVGWAKTSTAEQPPATVPVVIAVRDLPVGTVLAVEDLAQKQVDPARLTSSWVKPDSATYVIGQPLLVPMLEGDWLAWGFLESPRGDVDAVKACAERQPKPGDARAELARTRRTALSATADSRHP